MPARLKFLRGLKNIRTHAARLDPVTAPYKAYMAITALEMEKFRCQTECQNLNARLKNLSERLRSIQADKAALLARLNELPDGRSMARRRSRATGARPRTDGRFMLKY